MIVDNDLCEYPPNYPNNTLDCDGNCINDADGMAFATRMRSWLHQCLSHQLQSAATDDDGSCIIPGCTDADAENYNPAATEDDGTCQFLITGTRDAPNDATNYDAEADLDDGSCEFDCSVVATGTTRMEMDSSARPTCWFSSRFTVRPARTD